jgi:cytoskeletal protein CcmA (bactofilin family)
MFGRRNPDRPLDMTLPEPSETDLDLDLLEDLPDIIVDDDEAKPEPREATPKAAEPTAPEIRQDERLTDPAWHASAPSILGPSVTRMLQAQAESHSQPQPPSEESVPRTDLESTQQVRAFVPPPPPTIVLPPAPASEQPSAAPASEAAAPRPRGIAESVIGPDDFFDGRYRSERGVRIQGNVRGSIESRQYIFVEAGAEVEADLSAEDITVSGDFKGKITCRRRLEVSSTGKIQGQVQTALLVVQEGGAIDGELQMRSDQTAAAGGE